MAFRLLSRQHEQYKTHCKKSASRSRGCDMLCFWYCTSNVAGRHCNVVRLCFDVKLRRSPAVPDVSNYYHKLTSKKPGWGAALDTLQYMSAQLFAASHPHDAAQLTVKGWPWVLRVPCPQPCQQHPASSAAAACTSALQPAPSEAQSDTPAGCGCWNCWTPGTDATRGTHLLPAPPAAVVAR